MGCWNGTDLITQLPIMYGDEVALIPIKQNEYAHLNAENPRYCNTYFKPLPVVLYGEYDDYGCIENITGDIEQFKEVVEKESDRNEDEILKKIENYVSDNNTIIESYVRYVERGEINSVGFILIHKELFDKLKDYYGWDDKEEAIEEYYKAINSYKKISDYLDENESLDKLISSCNWFTFDKININNVNKESISAILSIQCVLETTRKYWFPQSGAGGQMQIEEPHRVIQEFYNKYLENYDREDEE